jgi:hypothetical protein
MTSESGRRSTISIARNASSPAFSPLAGTPPARHVLGVSRTRASRGPQTLDGGRQHFDRDLAMELGVARTKHLTHPTDADAGTDFIRAEARAGVRAKVARLYGPTVSRMDSSCLTPQGLQIVERHRKNCALLGASFQGAGAARSAAP